MRDCKQGQRASSEVKMRAFISKTISETQYHIGSSDTTYRYIDHDNNYWYEHEAVIFNLLWFDVWFGVC